MKESNWRGGIDQVIEQNLSELILETKEYDSEIRQARNRGKAQMWVAMAILNHKLNKILINEKGKKYEKKIPKEEMDNILNTLEKL